MVIVGVGLSKNEQSHEIEGDGVDELDRYNGWLEKMISLCSRRTFYVVWSS